MPELGVGDVPIKECHWFYFNLFQVYCILHNSPVTGTQFSKFWQLHIIHVITTTIKIANMFITPRQNSFIPFMVKPPRFPWSLATQNLISVRIISPFPECPISGVQYLAFESPFFHLVSSFQSSVLLPWFCFLADVELEHPHRYWWPHTKFFVTVSKVWNSFSGAPSVQPHTFSEY